MASGSPAYDVFVSYAREDAAWVRANLFEPLARCRTADGAAPRVWMDDAPSTPGQNFMDAVEDVIRHARTVIAVYSAAYFRSSMCQWELTKAFELAPSGTRRRLLPVLIDSSAAGSVPLMASHIQHLQATGADWLSQLCVLLEFTMLSGVAAPAAIAPPRPPDDHGVRDLRVGDDVFLSFKSEDVAFAQEVFEFLGGHGLRVFFSRVSLPTLGSDEYHEQIDAAIDRARHMVVATTSGNHAASKWVKYEWRLFLGERLAGRKAGNLVTVIPSSLAIAELPISLRNREVILFTPDDRSRLLDYVRGSDAEPGR
jgi:hypothetical protein